MRRGLQLRPGSRRMGGCNLGGVRRPTCCVVSAKSRATVECTFIHRREQVVIGPRAHRSRGVFSGPIETFASSVHSK